LLTTVPITVIRPVKVRVVQSVNGPQLRLRQPIIEFVEGRANRAAPVILYPSRDWTARRPPPSNSILVATRDRRGGRTGPTIWPERRLGRSDLAVVKKNGAKQKPAPKSVGLGYGEGQARADGTRERSAGRQWLPMEAIWASHPARHLPATAVGNRQAACGDPAPWSRRHTEQPSRRGRARSGGRSPGSTS
jgi:hypothetical protein